MDRRFPRALRLVAVVVAALAALGPPARAFEQKRTEDGAPLRWTSRRIRVELSMAGAPAGLDEREARRAIRRAFAVWDAELPDGVRLEVVEVKTTVPLDPDDGRHVLRWVGDGWEKRYQPTAIAATRVEHDAAGRITDADVALNATLSWTTRGARGCESAYDLQAAVTHELGHLLGLAHERDERHATMFPSTPLCDARARDLHADDRAGVRAVFTPDDARGGPRRR